MMTYTEMIKRGIDINIYAYLEKRPRNFLKDFHAWLEKQIQVWKDRGSNPHDKYIQEIYLFLEKNDLENPRSAVYYKKTSVHKKKWDQIEEAITKECQSKVRRTRLLAKKLVENPIARNSWEIKKLKTKMQSLGLNLTRVYPKDPALLEALLYEN